MNIAEWQAESIALFNQVVDKWAPRDQFCYKASGIDSIFQHLLQLIPVSKRVIVDLPEGHFDKFSDVQKHDKLRLYWYPTYYLEFVPSGLYLFRHASPNKTVIVFPCQTIDGITDAPVKEGDTCVYRPTIFMMHPKGSVFSKSIDGSDAMSALSIAAVSSSDVEKNLINWMEQLLNVPCHR
ncbi:hypothetical protein HY486_03740 [Candidatus Woesearchaeota archaeon]|nr:hypothetical protein [Candidatus Woesearchaeota archaeon]